MSDDIILLLIYIHYKATVCNSPLLIYLSLLQGSNLPTSNTSSQCINATINLFGPDDDCSRAVQEVLDGNGNDSMISFIFSGDCPNRFYYYATTCSMGGDNDMVSTGVHTYVHTVH